MKSKTEGKNKLNFYNKKIRIYYFKNYRHKKQRQLICLGKVNLISLRKTRRQYHISFRDQSTQFNIKKKHFNSVSESKEKIHFTKLMRVRELVEELRRKLF